MALSLTVILISILFSPASSAKKRCKPFLAKLHKIQASQRSSYSLKRGESLRASEDKARDKWWECENSSKAKFNAKYGSKKKKTKKKKVVKSKPKKQSIQVSRNYTQLNKSTAKTNTRFNQHSAIVIKSKFQGEKHLAWLAYYNKPIKCQRPKSISVFAYCNENKRQQQDEFEQKYQK